MKQLILNKLIGIGSGGSIIRAPKHSPWVTITQVFGKAKLTVWITRKDLPKVIKYLQAVLDEDKKQKWGKDD